ncbi:hypothetical protein LTS08_004776 [Lithohypha guttulata]|uniref:Xylulose kinase n=1 Tax=Lithohypha guttulata TaxID=1690604 RepID=A0AAN7Y811_9EURO|nr:hypothetical protein LTR05_002382 [Lithohypha guttulata]KAK5101170.1 hypothetical protein LTS08_004776 [Lithohypha guttulata]
MSSPVYLGFDLSTQQLKGLAVSSDLKSVGQATFDFDKDAQGFKIHKGVLTNEAEKEVFAPVAMWLQALDTVLTRLKDGGLNLSRVKGISGAGMQHGSVFWNADAESLLKSLDPAKTLEVQLDGALAHPFSPNWQDASTQKECDEFDRALGSPADLAKATGSKAHHRFTGPQILRFQRKYPEKYQKTARITLVSSWLASIFLGKFAPFDISDVCGMNLWDINAGTWNEKVLELTSGTFGIETLKQKLGGSVPQDGGAHFGNISSYFVERFGFSPDCEIIASTGDNPSTILALPLQPNDAIVSLGTSSTFLMSTSEYLPDPSTHFFNHPTTAGLYMFMLCYKNGGLAREQVRDLINQTTRPQDTGSTSWDDFDKYLLSTPPLAQQDETQPFQLGIYFPRPEIVPNLPEGQWHFQYDPKTDTLTETAKTPNHPYDSARIIVESQLLSMRLRAKDLVRSPDPENSLLPPQPRRIYLVGGASRNRAIAKVAGQVLGGGEGVFKLDLGENACALGAAYKAVWACERSAGQSFEELIGSRWDERDFVERVADGYDEETYERYGRALKGFEAMERELLAKHLT